ncbi:MAG: DUF4836 family protein [Bacteroidota bacterium]
MKWHLHLIAIATVTFFFTSCKDSNTQGRYIPASASLAVHINGKTLSEKLPWSEIKANPLFENVYADSSVSASVKKILDNPDNSGMDSKADVIFFMQRDAEGGYIAVQGSVKDDAVLKTLATEIIKNGTASEKDGINYISNSRQCFGWNKEKFILVADVPELDALSKRMMQDSIDISGSKKRDVAATCKAVFDLDESKSLAKDEKFGKLVKENGDLHFWINTEEMNKNSSASGMMAMVNLEKLYKGSFTTGTVNFDNGKINVSMKSYAGEELKKLHEKFSGGKVSSDMLKKIPGKDILGAVALNFKPEGLKEFLKILNLDGAVNIATAKMKFTLDDFVKANKGDIVIGVSDFAMATDTMEGIEIPKPDFNFVFAGSIGDKESFNKLVNAGKNLSGSMAKEDGSLPFAFSSNAGYFALSNTQANADQYINGSGIDFDFISKISGEPMGGYFNIQSILKAVGPQASKDSLAKVVYDASLKIWDNIIFKGGEFKDGAMLSTAEINLVDKNTNSLKQLNAYLNVISQVIKEKDKKQKEDMMALEDALQNSNLGDVPATIPEEAKKK